VKTLLIDNYDSYTYNVFHLLAAVSGEEPIVVHNDAVSWRALERWDFDAIVLSPGPGRPERWHDFGVCADVLRQSQIPVLGVCLGHQGIGQMLNGHVDSAPVVMHGRLSEVHHDATGLFKEIPQGFKVVRYHSLMVGNQLGQDGRVTAWTDEGIVMGVEHRRRPIWGVQFHPESIATQHGRKLFENYYELAAAHRRQHPESRDGRLTPPQPKMRQRKAVGQVIPVRMTKRTLTGTPSAELLFERLFGDHEHAFWLDSADAPTRLAQRSFLGTSAGPERLLLEYDVEEKIVTRRSAQGTQTESGSIFEALETETATRPLAADVDLPAGLAGGFVGYLGYECKADCGSPNVHRSDVPDAVMMFANRIVTIDHVAQQTTVIALCRGDDDQQLSWLGDAEKAVAELISKGPTEAQVRAEPVVLPTTDDRVVFRCGRGRERYLADIERCQAELAAGESYEVCLTDQIRTDAEPEPFLLYRCLRRRNPAPFSAFLKLGEGLTIVSSSPERFIGMDRERTVQARPIKGTVPRSANPSEDRTNHDSLLNDEKTFAEHLMIVDLLRNDLGRVCELDSVRVPELMIVEEYATVHQLISTITGTLDDQHTPVQLVRACFPGGSMTGAPKLRTMGIIDGIEREARGVYSGSIGYFGLDGSVDLNIVIRTIIMRPGATTIGAGGAIVMQSDPQEEFEEILLKARAPMAAIAETITGSGEPGTWTVEFEREKIPARATP
jgi:para-aminobenzoate synthetase